MEILIDAFWQHFINFYTFQRIKRCWSWLSARKVFFKGRWISHPLNTVFKNTVI